MESKEKVVVCELKRKRKIARAYKFGDFVTEVDFKQLAKAAKQKQPVKTQEGYYRVDAIKSHRITKVDNVE